MYEDSGTATLTLTPQSTVEILYFYDTLLFGTILRRYDGSLQSRSWSATVASRRWDGSLNLSNWSSEISRRWAATLGRQ